MEGITVAFNTKSFRVFRSLRINHRDQKLKPNPQFGDYSDPQFVIVLILRFGAFLHGEI